jgi:hypothetical protein
MIMIMRHDVTLSRTHHARASLTDVNIIAIEVLQRL